MFLCVCDDLPAAMTAYKRLIIICNTFVSSQRRKQRGLGAHRETQESHERTVKYWKDRA